MRMCINVTNPKEHVFYDRNNDVIYGDIHQYFDQLESSSVKDASRLIGKQDINIKT